MVVLLVGHVRQERDLTRPHDRRAEFALVQRAGARDAARQHLAALRDEAGQHAHVLVVDVVDLVRTELADLPAPEESAAPTLVATLGVLGILGGGSSACRSTPLSSSCRERSIYPSLRFSCAALLH